MALYWQLFLIPLVAAATPVKPALITQRIFVILVIAALTAIIGGRDGIGCDWISYDDMFYNSQFSETLAGGDIGYILLNRIFYEMGFQIYAVNFVCAIIFATGLLSFSLRQPNPPLTLALAVPYLIIVVSMGYTRQATALGFLMLAFGAFTDQSLTRYLILIALAATFHKTAVVFGILAIFMNTNKKFSGLLITLSTTAVLVFFLLLDRVDFLLYGYVESAMDSDGGIYRISWNVGAAVSFLLLRPHWKTIYKDARLYLILAIAIVICAPAYAFAPAAIDRMNIYFLPFQIGVFARIPEFGKNTVWQPAMLTAVIVVYAASLYVWLNFASHANCWLPYTSILI